MSTDALEPDAAWTPTSCTLPSADRPLRVAEFDDLFTRSLRALDRHDLTGLRLDLASSPEVVEQAASLVVRETACCSFFTFTLTATGGELWLEITVPPSQAAVLDALTTRASAAAGLPR
ncbi:hypothetical protein [Actinocrispum wychmicini]|uniref:Arsenate reductase n=1 Tax=Actinocrispum wychmicini TaxID=1213861 RepID=A0A4R2JQ23_9PSEU|nr:hypothetical protein [Actinocrispum wychmicini]TCO59268.1 hypothetical protein EV192_104109 [Actinocrispum wychmicini]